MNALIKLDAPELATIDKSKAEQIRAVFAPMVAMLENFENAYNEVIQEAQNEINVNVIAKAKRVRLDIAKIRIAAEKARIEQKEEYLRAGKAIDGVNNILKWAVKGKEDNLEKIEKHFEIMEKERIERLQAERVEMISPYLEDANERRLCDMEPDVWNAYFSAKKKEYDDRVEAERKAELERIEREKKEAEERERMRIENERLKKEAEERERIAKIEQEKREKEELARKAKEEKERKEREEKERLEREAHEKQLEAERKERERIAKQLKEKEDHERREREAKEAREQAELNKGDAEKLNDLIAELESIKSKYTFKAKQNIEKYNYVNSMIDRILKEIK